MQKFFAVAASILFATSAFAQTAPEKYDVNDDRSFVEAIDPDKCPSLVRHHEAILHVTTPAAAIAAFQAYAREHDQARVIPANEIGGVDYAIAIDIANV